jgi:Tol biopolymer transport system component/predicted Ser/Thr protein kinase
MRPGEKLGPYDILAPIGAGGMGEVYRARDPRLNRDVAIKTSREQFNDRFQREARAVAALNHPNICHLYDVGPNYLVMELVEGETLAERIKRGALPLDEALQAARQIADALEAAHEKGIVHRDLKPANIKITPEGTVKVLDFGLARVASPESSDPHESPTTLGSPTIVGTILGTAAYMAPEQARGKAVDKRADIWAFGVVMYEMVTGKQLFAGETVSDVLAGVLKQEPDLSVVPEQVRRLIADCLEKDPRKRLRDIGDYSRLIESGTEVPPQTEVRPTSRWKAASAVLAVLTVAAVSFAAWMWRRPAPLPEVTRFQIDAPPGSALPLGTPAPSPDGRMLAYTVRGPDGITRIHVRPMDSTESRVLPGTENAVHPFWSPDGRSLAFAASGELKRIDLAGGSARSLVGINGPWHGSWSQAGVIAFTAAEGSSQISAEGGVSTPAVKLDDKKGESGSGFPFFLSDNKQFLLEVSHADGSRDVELGSLGSMARKLVLPGVFSAPILAPAGNGKTYLLYLRDTSLMAQEFDENSGAVRGSPFLLVDAIGRVANPAIRPAVGVSSSGVLAYQTGEEAEAFRLDWLDRSGKALSGLPPAAGGRHPNLSPDGRMAAVEKTSNTGSDIWIVDLARGSSTRFTFASDGKSYTYPIWSPDGKRVAYRLVGGGIYVRDADGAGVEQELSKSAARPLSWSADGRQILVLARANPAQPNRLFLLPVSGRQTPIPIGPPGVLTDYAGISPDGNYFAFSSGESGRGEVYVEAMPPKTGKWQISINGGQEARWRKDGKELFFVSPDRKMMAVDIQTGQGVVTAGVPHPLFQVPNGANGFDYDISPDGRRFLISTPSANAANAPITVVLNWWAGLKK